VAAGSSRTSLPCGALLAVQEGGRMEGLRLVSRQCKRLAVWTAGRGPDPHITAMVFWLCETVLWAKLCWQCRKAGQWKVWDCSFEALLSITHCITLHCMALHCITSHCIPFHCIALHLCGATMHLRGADTICKIIESGVGGRGREPFNYGKLTCMCTRKKTTHQIKICRACCTWQ